MQGLPELNVKLNREKIRKNYLTLFGIFELFSTTLSFVKIMTILWLLRVIFITFVNFNFDILKIYIA